MGLILKPEKIVAGGNALARDGKRVVFIPYGCPGDTVNVHITSEKKDYAFADIVEIQQASDVRIQPPCQYYFDPIKSLRYKQYIFCGGCNMQHVDYRQQLVIKKQIIVDAFAKICGMNNVPCEPVVGMDEPWSYRNKVQLPVGKHRSKILVGFYKPGSHVIVDIDTCLIQDPIATRIVNTVRRLLEKSPVIPYNEDKHTGHVRHVLIRTSRFSRKALVTFITKSEDFPRKRLFIDNLIHNIPEISGIYQNVNTRRTNVILGRYTQKLWGNEYIEEKIGHCRFAIKPTAFFQVNPLQTEKLYGIIKDMARLSGKETVYDLYCGSGGIGIFCAKGVVRVIGIDESRESIGSARKNAQLNRLSNCSFYAGDVEKELYNVMQKKVNNPVIILDPPRAGCSEKLLNLISNTGAKILYVSCHPATCARDIRILISRGYCLQKIIPVDMFPQTAHIEIAALLDKKHVIIT